MRTRAEHTLTCANNNSSGLIIVDTVHRTATETSSLISTLAIVPAWRRAHDNQYPGRINVIGGAVSS